MLVEELAYRTKEEIDFSWDTGASKCVIIPTDEDYVIKIPFDGDWSYYPERNFCSFVSGGGEGWDYCKLEQEMYEDIIISNPFSDFFLPNISIENNKWPIYIQKKAIVFSETMEDPYDSVESVYKVRTESKSRPYINLPDEWLAVCLENLNNDIEKLDEFLDFLLDNFSDLHQGNIGYLDGHAIILDYGGYDE